MSEASPLAILEAVCLNADFDRRAADAEINDIQLRIKEKHAKVHRIAYYIGDILDYFKSVDNLGADGGEPNPVYSWEDKMGNFAIPLQEVADMTGEAVYTGVMGHGYDRDPDFFYAFVPGGKPEEYYDFYQAFRERQFNERKLAEVNQ